MDDRPGQFLRGPFHTTAGGVERRLKRGPDGVVTRCRYSHQQFTGKSGDIRRLCTDALDLLGIALRPNGAHRIAVSRREAVAAPDEHVGHMRWAAGSVDGSAMPSAGRSRGRP